MRIKNKNALPDSKKRMIYGALAIACALLLLIPVTGVVAKYITAKKLGEAQITPALFYTNGEYMQKIESDTDTVPEFEVSGWSTDGITLKLQNHDTVGGEEKVSEVDLTYTIEITVKTPSAAGGWTYTTEKVTIPANTAGDTTITLIPPTGAKQGDEIEFKLTTGPYAVTMKAEFVLSDSNIPEWKLEDKGEYSLLTVYTNDYEGEITVNYNSTVFAPDSTNEKIKAWVRAEKTYDSGTFAAERFTVYQIRFYEEVSKNYLFTLNGGEPMPIIEGTGTIVNINEVGS